MSTAITAPTNTHAPPSHASLGIQTQHAQELLLETNSQKYRPPSHLAKRIL
jgi:hypothetical protein